MLKVYKKCPKCGFESNPSSKNTLDRFVASYHPLVVWCPKCNYCIVEKNTCPICSFEDKVLKQKHKGFGAVCECPSCGNSFGVLEEKIEPKKYRLLQAYNSGYATAHSHALFCNINNQRYVF